MTQPAFGRSDQAAWHTCSLPTREFTHHMLLRTPGKIQATRSQFMFAGKVNTRGKQRSRQHLAGTQQLRNGEIDYRGVGTALRLNRGDGTIRRAQINPDYVLGIGVGHRLGANGRSRAMSEVLSIAQVHSSPLIRTFSSSFQRPCPWLSRQRTSKVPSS